VLRVSYPNQTQQAAAWHFHQRVVPEPRPPFFVRPALIDHLLYLDDLTMDSGPLVVMPGTHLRDEHLPGGDFAEKNGEVVITCPAGSVVTAHTSLWHRAMAPRPGSRKRRMIIWAHSSTWMKQIDKPSAGAGRGLSDRLVPGADEEMRELLGLAGWY
jgi:ectoine hydroxylase-related dioxygenase (phytanoyl-CoA dioxygenase family)